MNQAGLRPRCALTWHDINDCPTACVDDGSVATTIELAAAGRTAYNWLN